MNMIFCEIMSLFKEVVGLIYTDLEKGDELKLVEECYEHPSTLEVKGSIVLTKMDKPIMVTSRRFGLFYVQ